VIGHLVVAIVYGAAWPVKGAVQQLGVDDPLLERPAGNGC
jgi:hypothetical protein